MDGYDLVVDSFDSFSYDLVDLCLKYGCTLHYISKKRIVIRMPSHWFSDSVSPVIKFF